MRVCRGRRKGEGLAVNFRLSLTLFASVGIWGKSGRKSEAGSKVWCWIWEIMAEKCCANRRILGFGLMISTISRVCAFISEAAWISHKKICLGKQIMLPGYQMSFTMKNPFPNSRTWITLEIRWSANQLKGNFIEFRQKMPTAYSDFRWQLFSPLLLVPRVRSVCACVCLCVCVWGGAKKFHFAGSFFWSCATIAAWAVY